jgi:hypothetical protein
MFYGSAPINFVIKWPSRKIPALGATALSNLFCEIFFSVHELGRLGFEQSGVVFELNCGFANFISFVNLIKKHLRD